MRIGQSEEMNIRVSAKMGMRSNRGDVASNTWFFLVKRLKSPVISALTKMRINMMKRKSSNR